LHVHTPGHATINLAVLGTAFDPGLAVPILAGGILPDVPIISLYLFHRWIRDTPEERIWSEHYQRPFWQNLIHGMHSIPLHAIGLVVSLSMGSIALAVFFSSALLHALQDLPVHAIDAHRHFLPFSQWRFISPISYWDPKYHGRSVALVEALLVVMAAVVVWLQHRESYARICLAGVVLFYAFSYWRSFLRRTTVP
jgi:hypothetical protein